MAADGSLKFDTKIDTSDFDASISTLEKALDRLSKSVDKLSSRIAGGFQGAGEAAGSAAKEINSVGESAAGAAEGLDSIGEAAGKAQGQVDDLKKQMEAVSVQHWQDNGDASPVDKGKIQSDIDFLESALEEMAEKGKAEGDELFDSFSSELEQLRLQLQEVQSGIGQASPERAAVGASAFNYDPQAMAMVFGEAAAEVGNYAEAVQQFGVQAGSAMNGMSQDSVQAADAAGQAGETAAEVTDQISQSEQHVNYFKAEIAALKEKLEELASMGFYFGDDEYDSAYQSLKRLENELSEYKNQLMSQDWNQSEYMGIAASVVNAFKNVPAVFAKIPEALAGAMSKVPAITKTAFSKAVMVVTKFGKALAYPVTSSVKRAVSGIKQLIFPAGKAGNAILKLSNMFKLMVIRMAMRAAVEGVRDGMRNLVQYSSEANQSVSSLMTGMTYLKNSFAAAFSPILSMVAPALNTLINLLATALNYINQFFSALGGSTAFVKAKKVNEDYAESLKAAGGAAAQAGKDAKKALAPFDELTVLQDQASSGSGGGGAGGTDPSQMFETVAVNDAVNGFAERIRKAFEAGDWKELGTLIGSKFNEIVDGIDWGGMGHRLGRGINGAVQTAYYALKEADFVNLGNHVAEFLNGGLEEIDFTFVGRLLTRGFTAGIDFFLGLLGGLNWGLVGKSVGDALRGSFEEAYDWITGMDWSQMAHSLYSNIKAFLLGVDFASLAESFFKALGAALAAAASFVASFVGDIWDDITGYFSSYITNDDGTKKCGMDWVDGILEGILDGIAGIAAWIWQHVALPLVNGFKDAFGIHSPSTVMAELGGYLMEGLLNRITEMLPDVADQFGALKERISGKWDEVRAAASEKWAGIQSDLSSIWGGLKENAGTVFGQLGDSIKKAWEDVRDNTKATWERGGITGIVSGSVNAIISSVEAMVNQVIRAINGLISGINRLSIDIPDTPFSDGFTLGFNLPSLSEVNLPRLAAGTVVPPRAGEFAAILGDNKREAEVVSPVSTIKQALREILEETQGMSGGDIHLTLNLDGKVIYNDVIKRNQMAKKQTGKNPLLV